MGCGSSSPASTVQPQATLPAVPKSPSTAAPAGPAVSPPAGEQKSDGSKMATDVSQHTPQASVETASTNPASTAAAAPSSAETLAAIASGRRSCVEVISGALAAVAATNGKLNGCIEVLGEPALAAARAVDAKVAATEPLGKLAGLPIVVKANIDVDGSLSTAATPALKDWRPSTNATVVQALVDAGAIVVAKTNMPEFAQRGDGWCSLHGNCLNPTNPTRSSGGSSSGTAVAVAARYVTVGLGSDTAGSTRIPAACCGIVGMRPSRGRWPSAGCIPLDDYKDTVGPMGATVGDVALLDAVVCGDGEPPAAPASLKGVKILVAHDWIDKVDNTSDTAREAVAVAQRALETAGATVMSHPGFLAVVEGEPRLLGAPQPHRLPMLQAYLDRHSDRPEAMQTAEQVAKLVADKLPKLAWLGELEKGYDDEKRKAFDEYLAGAKEATEAAYRKFFADHGITAVMVPTIPDEPPCVSEWTAAEEPSVMGFVAISKFTIAFNNCSVPSLSLPTTVTGAESGIPMSVLLWGVDDRELLGVGAALEAAMKR